MLQKVTTTLRVPVDWQTRKEREVFLRTWKSMTEDFGAHLSFFFFVPATNCRGSWSRRWTCVRQRPGATARSQRNSRREYRAVFSFEYSNMQSTWTFYWSHRAARRTLKHINTQLSGYQVLRSKYSICWSHNTKRIVCRIHSNRKINSIIWYD